MLSISGVGTEGSTVLILEDLWVNFAIASLLRNVQTDPIKDWQDFYHCQGIGYALQKRYVDAIACYTWILNVYAPNESIFYVARGNDYFLQNDYPHALADFEQAILLDVQSASAYNGLGSMYLKMGDITRAIEQFTRAIAYKPHDASFYAFRGNAYSRQGNGKLAIADFARSIELDPKYAWAYGWRGNTYLAQQNDALALADFDNALALNPKDVFAYNARADIYARKNDYAHAIADFNRVIWLTPDDALAYIRRGNASLAQKDYSSAMVDYNKAIELNPTLAQAYSERGGVYWEQQKYDLAIADLDKAIELDPTYLDAYVGRGHFYYEQHKYEHAIADFNQVIKLDPKLAIAYNSRGNAYSGQHDYDQAIADYNRAILLEPNNAVFYSNRGLAYCNQGDYSRAIADLDQAIMLDPKNAIAYSRRGDVSFHQEDYPRAIEDYDQAIKLDPWLAIAYKGRGDAYTNLGDLSRASADYISAKTIEDETKASAIAPTFVGAPEKEGLHDFNISIPTTPVTEQTSNISDETNHSFVQSEFVIDEKDVLTRIKRKDVSASWQIYSNEDNPVYTIIASVLVFLLPSGLLIGVVAGSIALFHLPRLFWLSGLSLLAIILWGGIVLLVSIETIRAKKLVIMPEGFVYEANADLSSHYGALKDLSVIENKITLIFNNGEEKTASLSVSSQALQDLRKSYLQFKDQAPAISFAPTAFLDGKAVLARVKQGNIPASWQVHIGRNAFIAGGMLAAFCTGICLGVALAVEVVFHLQWSPWLWLAAFVLWVLLTLLFNPPLRGTKLVIMPEGFVYDTNLSVSFESLEKMSIQKRDRVTLVFRNGKEKEVSLSVTETALQDLQSAYLAFKVQQLPMRCLNGREVLARIKQKDLPPPWQVDRDPAVLITTLSTAHYSALLAALCVGIGILVAIIFHLSWQAWTQWFLLGGLVLWGVITAGYGLCFRRCRLVVMPEGFVYREAFEEEPGLAFYYDVIEEMSVRNKKVTFVFKNGRQITVKFSVSEASLQHLQNTYLVFKAL